jgi:bZIP transcription factor
MFAQKRRSQNRKSQQAFRDRQRKRVAALEQKVKELLENYKLLQDQYCNLNIAYSNLLRQKERPDPIMSSIEPAIDLMGQDGVASLDGNGDSLKTYPEGTRVCY